MITDIFDEIQASYPQLYDSNGCRNDIPGGWKEIAVFLHEGLAALPSPPKISQIKEKMGALRVYLAAGHANNEQAKTLISEAVNWSTHVCAITGEPGRLMNIGGFMVVASDKAAEQIAKERGVTIQLPVGHAVYPGSFDPITSGHLDVIRSAMQCFGKLTIGIGVNPRKTPFFDQDMRAEMIRRAVMRGVFGGCQFDIVPYEGLTVDFCNRIGANIIARGLRAVADFESELQMAQANDEMNSLVHTVFFPTHASNSFISSSLVREVVAQKKLGLAWKWMPRPAYELMKESLNAEQPD